MLKMLKALVTFLCELVSSFILLFVHCVIKEEKLEGGRRGYFFN